VDPLPDLGGHVGGFGRFLAQAVGRNRSRHTFGSVAYPENARPPLLSYGRGKDSVVDDALR